MQLLKATLLCSVLTLAACSGSESTPGNTNEPNDSNTPVNTDMPSNTDTPAGTDTASNVDTPVITNPPITDTTNGSITISTAQAPNLESLPDVTYTPGTNSSDAGSVGDEASASPPISSPSLESGDADGAATGDGGIAESSTSGTTSGTTGGTTGGTADTSVADTASESSDSGSGDEARPESVIIEPTFPQPDFQAGTLTAADYDDQLNPHLYQRYASEYLQRVGGQHDVPYLDLSNRIGLHVTDDQGRSYGGVRIDITDANGEILSLETPANGITYIYSDVDQLPAQFTIRATGIYGTAIDQTIELAQLGSARIDIVVPEDSAPPAGTRPGTGLDIMFVIDTTGSMGDELNYLQTELTSILNGLQNNPVATNIGLTFYRDIGDEYVVRAHGFNDDLASVERTLNDETFAGGGDYPEAMDQALHQAIDANWQQDSHKILFLIADAPPHDNKMRATWNAAEQARAKNIHIVPVAASGVGEGAEYLMRSIAAYTNSRYVFLTDDSGFGNSHAEPDVDCYAVTQLNNLMIRVLNSLIKGVRQEPGDNEIIRTVGNYNEGVCEQQ